MKFVSILNSQNNFYCIVFIPRIPIVNCNFFFMGSIMISVFSAIFAVDFKATHLDSLGFSITFEINFNLIVLCLLTSFVSFIPFCAPFLSIFFFLHRSVSSLTFLEKVFFLFCYKTYVHGNISKIPYPKITL